MGIGNAIKAAWTTTGLKLITPHGDWELAEAVSLILSLFISLPLMGIGNPPYGWSLHSDNSLITPHGDWERVH